MPSNRPSPKLLIIRFSAFGDVTQALSIPSVVNRNLPEAQVHWVIRQDLSELLEGHPHIHQVYKLDRSLGLKGLYKIAQELRRQHFTHIYDAHNNLRSRFLSCYLRLFRSVQFIRKSQFRFKRFLLFTLRINTYQLPFSGQRDLLQPLQKWGWDTSLPPAPQLFLKGTESSHHEPYIAIAPSAAHALKRWPIDYWKQLIEILPHHNFKVLGGPGEDFLNELAQNAPNRVEILAGKLSLQQSAEVIRQAKLVISNDTGLLHIAEQLGKPTLALMGPAPFGYPSRSSTEILELNLPCKPCSKHGQGPCTNPNFQQCMRDISPRLVAQRAKHKLESL